MLRCGCGLEEKTVQRFLDRIWRNKAIAGWLIWGSERISNKCYQELLQVTCGNDTESKMLHRRRRPRCEVPLITVGFNGIWNHVENEICERCIVEGFAFESHVYSAHLTRCRHCFSKLREIWVPPGRRIASVTGHTLRESSRARETYPIQSSSACELDIRNPGTHQSKRPYSWLWGQS